MLKFKKVFLGLLVIIAGCSPHSAEDYQFEGEALCRAFVKELEKIRSREDLAGALPRIKKHYEALVSLMIEAKEFQRKHPDHEIADPQYYDHPYSETLKFELERICKLEGGRELLEKAEREALIRLDHCVKK
jgi:hypothetical protein